MNNNVKSIRIKRGIKEDLPNRVPLGEPIFCVDTKELYVGMGDTLPPAKINNNTDNDIQNSMIEIGEEQIALIDVLTELREFMQEAKPIIREAKSFISSKGKPNDTVTNREVTEYLK